MNRYWIVLLIAFPFLVAFIKPGQLKKIARVTLEFDASTLVPGQEFGAVLITTLKDSTQIRSKTSNFTINFADYEVELISGVNVIEKSRTMMALKVSDYNFVNPFIEIKTKLRRKPSIKHHLKIPIRYDLTQRVKYEGRDGYDPRSTTKNGYRQIPITNRVNIEFIDNEQTLTNNSDPAIIGGKGPQLDVYVSMLDTLEKSFVRVLVKDEFGQQTVKTLLPDIGEIEIQSVGGKGGISRSGGKGGDGGDITVYLSPKAKPYFDQIFIINHGGEGGELWRPKIDGQKLGPYGNEGKLEIVDWN